MYNLDRATDFCRGVALGQGTPSATRRLRHAEPALSRARPTSPRRHRQRSALATTRPLAAPRPPHVVNQKFGNLPRHKLLTSHFRLGGILYSIGTSTPLQYSLPSITNDLLHTQLLVTMTVYPSRPCKYSCRVDGCAERSFVHSFEIRCMGASWRV